MSRSFPLPSFLILLSAIFIFAACATQPAPQAAVPPRSAPTAVAQQPNIASATEPTPVSLALLKVEPVKGYIGSSFTINGEGLPPNQTIEFLWKTVDGNFSMQASAETIEFYERKFVEKRVALGKAVVDAQGRVSATFTAPEDFGEVHDIYGVINGKDIARGGFRILRQVKITPTEGALGTPITIQVKGLGAGIDDSTIAVRYDNQYMGFISAVTTRGTVSAVIRAAGAPGKHVIEIGNANKAVPYLNIQQSPVAHIEQFRFDFAVTEDKGAPQDTLDFPSAKVVQVVDTAAPKTASGKNTSARNVNATLEPTTGPILTKTKLRAANLPVNATVDLVWVSARGNRLSPSGWNLIETPLQQATTDANGSLQADLQVPDDLGGWHTVRVIQGDTVLAEIPYYVERSLVEVTPKRVKVGESFTIHVKGIGWTELDNTVAVTYDNAYIGYACGFNSVGDITLNMVATGEPGTHLIELWPTIYQGKGKPPWNYQLPHLSALEDGPGLTLGYKLPIYRLAIEVVE
ncbi:MAG: hypothetical protein HY741_20780 [Chloroflexi bacterium]|nr:hypothetical protein [Chloroflexota bacterium]